MGSLAGQQPRRVIDFILGKGSQVLALGAHPDDIEIGAGGTLRLLAERYEDLKFRLLVASADDRRRAECVDSASILLGDSATVETGEFRDGFIPYESPAAVKDWLASQGGKPDLVLAPWQDDSHQDHSFIGTVAWQLFRHATILEYEVIKWEAEGFTPNVYVPLSQERVDGKLDHLAASFPSQHDKPWYQRDVFEAVMLRRGVEHGQSRHAEGFLARKLALSEPSNAG